MIRKDVIIAILATFCLTASMFMITTSKSQSGVGEYNPWADYNGDGVIDIFDVVPAAVSFGATSTDITKPVNVTNFPLDENGNLKVGFTEEADHGKYTERIAIFSTQAQWSSYIVGGLILEQLDQCLFYFGFNPKKAPFNVTQACLQITAAPYGAGSFGTQQFVVVINGQSQGFGTYANMNFIYLSPVGINITDSTLLNSIRQGINELKILGREVPGAPMTAFEILLFIEYEY